MKRTLYLVPNSSLLSLSSPELEQKAYTGTAGLYSAVIPTPAAINVILRIAHRLGFDLDASKLHCTVMYSKEKCPGAEVSCDAGRVFTAKIQKVQHWDGHNGKGYLSLALVSDELTAEHNRLKELGCAPTFDYNPHITIWSGVPLTVPLERRMIKAVPPELRGAEIKLTGQFIGDLGD